MSDTGKNNSGKNSWRMELGSQNEDTPEYSTKITINIHTSDDTPPALITAISGLVAEIIKTASSPAELEGIAEWLNEKRASHQRRADHAARMLMKNSGLGSPDRLCERCGKLRDDVDRVRYRNSDPEPELRGQVEWLCEGCFTEVSEQYDDSDDAPVGVEEEVGEEPEP